MLVWLKLEDMLDLIIHLRYLDLTLAFVDDGDHVPPHGKHADDDNVEDERESEDDPREDLPDLPLAAVVLRLIVIRRLRRRGIVVVIR